MGARDLKRKIRYASYVLWPKEGDVVQLRSDFWVIYENGLWRIMTDQEMLNYD